MASAEQPNVTPQVMPRVLLAEDEFLVRMTVAEALSDDGFEVLEASTAVAALDLLRANPGIVALLTDIQLSGATDGFSLVDTVRETHPDIAVIYMSGRPDKRPAGNAAREAYLTKPFLPSQVVAAVRGLIAGT